MKSAAASRRRHGRGFTLIEMLVALLVLSIGLLGMAGLQLTGLKNNLSSSLRSQATYLCYDLLDRIRSNRSARAEYEVAYADESAPANAVAALDLSDWRAALASTLPGGEGEVEVAGPTDNQIIVRVRWDDSRGADDDLIVFTMETEL
jgi:type IV pilus assembly protein PilV